MHIWVFVGSGEMKLSNIRLKIFQVHTAVVLIICGSVSFNQPELSATNPPKIREESLTN